MTIPGHLTHYLDDLELSRTHLAQLLGLSVRTVHNLEHGRKRADPNVLEQLGVALNQASQNKRLVSPSLVATLTDCVTQVASVRQLVRQSLH